VKHSYEWITVYAIILAVVVLVAISLTAW